MTRQPSSPTASPAAGSSLSWRGAGRVLLAVLLGAVVGTVGTVAHRTQLGDAGLPVGLVLALLVTVVAGVLVRAWTGWGGLLGYGAGWVAAVQLLSLRGPGGDVLVPAGTVGLVWAYGGLVAVGIVAFLPRSWFSERPVRRRRDLAPAPHAAPSVPPEDGVSR